MAFSRQQIKQSRALQFSSHKPYGKHVPSQTYQKYRQAPMQQRPAVVKAPTAPKPHRQQRKDNHHAAALRVTPKIFNSKAATIKQHPLQHLQQASDSSVIAAPAALPVPTAGKQAPEVATTATAPATATSCVRPKEPELEGCMILSIAACHGNKDKEALVTLQGGYNTSSVEAYRTYYNSQELNKLEGFSGWPATKFDYEALGYGVSNNKHVDGPIGESNVAAAAAAAALNVLTTSAMPAAAAAASAASSKTVRMSARYSAAIKHSLQSAWAKVEDHLSSFNCFGGSSRSTVKEEQYCGEDFGGSRTSSGADFGVSVSVTVTGNRITSCTTPACKSASSNRLWLQKLSFFGGSSRKDVLVGDDQ